jgi:hypothetical protein
MGVEWRVELVKLMVDRVGFGFWRVPEHGGKEGIGGEVFCGGDGRRQGQLRGGCPPWEVGCRASEIVAESGRLRQVYAARRVREDKSIRGI